MSQTRLFKDYVLSRQRAKTKPQKLYQRPDSLGKLFHPRNWGHRACLKSPCQSRSM